MELANPLTGAGCNIIMDCVGSHAGPGLAYSSGTRTLAVKLSPGGGLEYDVNGALRSTGGGGGGGTGWPTMADLENRGSNVVIGYLGAGYLIKPESLIRSYQFGQEQGLDAMHVPVRFLVDGAPVVYADEMLGRTAGEPWASSWNTQQVQDQDAHRVKIIPQLSGLDNIYLRNQPPGLTEPNLEIDPDAWNNAQWALRAPSFGWFGFLEQPQYGMTLLADVLREVGGRTPLILELRFPARDPSGAFIRPTPTWKTALFLNRTRKLIAQMGLLNSVVVTTADTEIPADVGTLQVLDFFSSVGIRVGPYIESMAASDKYPPNPIDAPVDPWPASWTWVFCSLALTKERIRQYRDLVIDPGPPARKLNTIAFVVNRQLEWSERVRDENLLGGMSGDPLYSYANVIGDVPQLANPLYRRGASSWNFYTIDHGLFPPVATPDNVKSTRRGHHQVQVERAYYGPAMTPVVAGKTYYALQGWLCPNPDPTAYGIQFTWGFDQLDEPTRSQGWLAFSFSRTTDAMFADWHDAAGGGPAAQSGYTLVATQAAQVFLFGWDAGAVVTMAQANMAAWSGPKLFRVGVNANGIRARLVNSDGSTAQELFSVRTPLARAHRGGYFHFGRYSAAARFWYAWISRVFTAAGGGDGPQ